MLKQCSGRMLKLCSVFCCWLFMCAMLKKHHWNWSRLLLHAALVGDHLMLEFKICLSPQPNYSQSCQWLPCTYMQMAVHAKRCCVCASCKTKRTPWVNAGNAHNSTQILKRTPDGCLYLKRTPDGRWKSEWKCALASKTKRQSTNPEWHPTPKTQKTIC